MSISHFINLIKQVRREVINQIIELHPNIKIINLAVEAQPVFDRVISHELLISLDDFQIVLEPKFLLCHLLLITQKWLFYLPTNFQVL